VIEESLNQLPYTPCTVITPIGCPYEGLRFEKGNCGVSIVRSGEAMEQGLRDCCRSMRIGKILIDSDHDTHEAKVVYAKFPDDISQRKVLLMYPIMSKYHNEIQTSAITLHSFPVGTGNTVVKAVRVLKDHNVLEENIVLANLFCTPQATQTIVTAFPQVITQACFVNLQEYYSSREK
jgi:uracil phosphoribosyltransferase